MRMLRAAVSAASSLVFVACGGGQPSATRSTATPSVTPEPQTAGAEGKQAASSVPEGFHVLTPALVVSDVSKAVEFYAEAFGAAKRLELTGPDGQSVVHAEIQIGDSIVMLGPERGDSKAPATVGGTNGGLMVYVEDVDVAFARALEAGGTETMAVSDMFWGDRYGQLVDPFGHRWSLATHKYELSDEEVDRRARAWSAAMAQGEQPPTFEPGPAASSFQPEGFFTVTPSLIVSGPEQVDFYRKALGAEVRSQMVTPDGRLMHAEVQIGDSVLMLSGEHPEMDAKARSAKSLGASPVSIMVYVPDASVAHEKALAAGAAVRSPVELMFWGDRFGEVIDPSGNVWGVATPEEELTPEQIRERMIEQYGGGGE